MIVKLLQRFIIDGRFVFAGDKVILKKSRVDGEVMEYVGSVTEVQAFCI